MLLLTDFRDQLAPFYLLKFGRRRYFSHNFPILQLEMTLKDVRYVCHVTHHPFSKHRLFYIILSPSDKDISTGYFLGLFCRLFNLHFPPFTKVIHDVFH